MKNNNNRSGQSTKIVKEIVWPTFVLFINAKSEEKKGSILLPKTTLSKKDQLKN